MKWRARLVATAAPTILLVAIGVVALRAQPQGLRPPWVAAENWIPLTTKAGVAIAPDDFTRRAPDGGSIQFQMLRGSLFVNRNGGWVRVFLGERPPGLEFLTK